MNRWKVQFSAAFIPATVTAPTAADALIVAASVVRRAGGRVAEEDARAPHLVEWLGPAMPAGMPGRAVGGEPSALEADEPVAAARREPTWKCKLCEKWATASSLESEHRHEDDPRSVYYVAPDDATVVGAAESTYPCSQCGSQIPNGKTVGPWHEQTCTLFAKEERT